MELVELRWRHSLCVMCHLVVWTILHTASVVLRLYSLPSSLLSFSTRSRPRSWASTSHHGLPGTGQSKRALLAGRGLPSTLQRERYPFQWHGSSGKRERGGTSEWYPSPLWFRYCFVKFLVKKIHIFSPCLCCCSSYHVVILLVPGTVTVTCVHSS